MLRFGLRRQLRGVGGKKRERRLFVSAVLGEVEVNAADEMPCRVLALQELLGRRLRRRELGSKGLGSFGPEPLEK